MLWSDDEITAGTEFDPRIREELESSAIIVLLLSSDYFNSQYCWNVEARAAMALHDAAKARVVPVLLRPVKWNVTPLAKYSIIPRTLVPVTSSPNPDEAFVQIVDEIDRVVGEIATHQVLSRSGALPKVVPQASVEQELFYCIPSCGEPTTARVAGITETIGDLVLHFCGDPGERRFADIWIFANVVITSRQGIDGLSESFIFPATRHNVSGLPTLGKGIHAVAGAVNALAFLHVPLHELRLLPDGERNLRVSNVRINASQLGLSATEKPSFVLLHVTVSDTTVAHPQFRVAKLEHRFRFNVSPPRGASNSFKQSASVNPELLHGPGNTARLSLLVHFTGGLAGYEQAPGGRTRLMLRFSNVPAGVRVFATTEQLSSAPDRFAGVLTTTDVNGAGPFAPPEVYGYTEFAHRFVPIAELPLSGGASQAVWELENAVGQEEQELTFGIVLAYVARPREHLPALGTAHVYGSFAPITSVDVRSPTAQIPRFVDAPTQAVLFSISF